MSIKDLKVKIRELRWDGSMMSPKYSISFKQPASEDESILNSFKILTAIKGDNDVVVEVNSSLFQLSSAQREACALDFIRSIRNLGLDYRYRKGVSQAKQSIFSTLFGSKDDKTAHEVLAYIPNSVWQRDDFYNILPAHGIRYYITKEPVDSSEILDSMSRMLDDEKLDYYKLTIFSASVLGYMGVNSNTLSLEDLKNALGL